MKTLHYLNMVLLLALAGCEGCKKDEPKPKTELEKLPPITQEGKNTFGCLVNGKAFVPLSFDSRAVYQLGTLQISGTRFEPYLQLGIIVNEKNYGLLNTTSYHLNGFPDSFIGAYSENSAQSCTYEYQNCFTGKITLSKLDRIRYIISGTFDFVTVAKDCDTLKITDGRFDIRYIP
jgi:hypothetical protein